MACIAFRASLDSRQQQQIKPQVRSFALDQPFLTLVSKLKPQYKIIRFLMLYFLVTILQINALKLDKLLVSNFCTVKDEDEDPPTPSPPACSLMMKEDDHDACLYPEERGGQLLNGCQVHWLHHNQDRKNYSEVGDFNVRVPRFPNVMKFF